MLLVGAGHAHLYVLNNATALQAAGYRVHLLSPRYFYYSGVASATAAGEMATEVGRIDVAALAERSGVTFHEDTLASLELADRVATTSLGERIDYDVFSLNIGSVVAPPEMTVEAGVLRVKPLGDLASLGDRLDAESTGTTITVVGGGATGLELAAHLAVRRGVAGVHLLEAGMVLGPELPPGARRRMLRLLEKRGVVVRRGCAVAHLGTGHVNCADGMTLAHDAAVLATGLAAPPVVGELGLGDGRGVAVRATLQHVDHDEIYAVGDCAHFLPEPLPRIGVHGVKQGPVLVASLLARLGAEPLPTYQPQRRALAILDLGDGTALATWGPLWWLGPAALRLKRRIDRKWLERYQVTAS